jgi:Na+/H+ antiporter NhaD/arsenite permease-like protein
MSGDVIGDRRLQAVSLAVLTLVTAAFVVHTVLRLEPAVVAIVGGPGAAGDVRAGPQRRRPRRRMAHADLLRRPRRLIHSTRL